MRGGALPPALLAAALGLLLAFAPRKSIAPAVGAFFAIAIAASLVRLGPDRTDLIFYACWASLAAAALAIHLPRARTRAWAIAFATNAGLWAGAVIGVAGTPLDLAKALPWVLLCLPGAWLVGHRLGLGLKVVASWLVAVSLLGALLPITTPTPGYAGDHME